MAFQKACSVSDVPAGGIREFEVSGRPIFVAEVEGAFYACDAACTHAGCSLGDGALHGPIVTCLCHGAQFDVRTGDVVRPPARRSVARHPCEVRGADVFVDL